MTLKPNFTPMKTSGHVIFWVSVLVSLTIIFAGYFNSVAEAFFFVSMLLPVVTGTCYFFNLWLVPRYLFTGKYFRFVLYSVYMLIVSLYLEMIVILLSFMYLAEYHYDNMSPISSDIFVLAITLYLIVFLFSFILLIRRSMARERTIESLREAQIRNQTASFSVRSDRQMRTILIEEVQYIESLGDYVKIHLDSGETVITKERISKLEERLPDVLVRIHRSFMVHKHKITALTREMLTVGTQELPFGRAYKKAAWERLTEEEGNGVK